MSLFDRFRAEQNERASTKEQIATANMLSPLEVTDDLDEDEVLDMILKKKVRMPQPRETLEATYEKMEFDNAYQRATSSSKEADEVPPVSANTAKSLQNIPKDEIATMCSDIFYSEISSFVAILMDEQRLPTQEQYSSNDQVALLTSPFEVILWIIFEWAPKYSSEISDHTSTTVSRSSQIGGTVRVKKSTAVPLGDFEGTSNAKSIMILHDEACRFWHENTQKGLRAAQHTPPFVCWYVVENMLDNNAPILSQVTLVNEQDRILEENENEHFGTKNDPIDHKSSSPKTDLNTLKFENLYDIGSPIPDTKDTSTLTAGEYVAAQTKRDCSPSIEMFTEDNLLTGPQIEDDKYIEVNSTHHAIDDLRLAFQPLTAISSTQPSSAPQVSNLNPPKQSLNRFVPHLKEDNQTTHSLGTTMVGASTTPPTPTELPLPEATPVILKDIVTEKPTELLLSRIASLEQLVSSQRNTIQELEMTVKQLASELNDLKSKDEHVTTVSSTGKSNPEIRPPEQNFDVIATKNISLEKFALRLHKTGNALTTPSTNFTVQTSVISSKRLPLTPAINTSGVKPQDTRPVALTERQERIKTSSLHNPMNQSLLYSSSFYQKLRPQENLTHPASLNVSSISPGSDFYSPVEHPSPSKTPPKTPPKTKIDQTNMTLSTFLKALEAKHLPSKAS